MFIINSLEELEELYTRNLITYNQYINLKQKFFVVGDENKQMTVTCKRKDCPLNDNNFCCSESILINNNGMCFNLIKGFAEDDIPKLKKESKMNIEEIDIEEKK